MSLTIQQIKERKKGIGGTDAAAICGFCNYKTARQVYFDKITDEIDEKTKDNMAIRKGNFGEEFVAKEYARVTGKKVRKVNKAKWHKEYKFMFANIDRKIVGENALLECKTAHAFMKNYWNDEGSDDVPVSYLMQCAHYAAVFNVKRVDIAVLFSDNDFRIYTYKRNLHLEKNLIEIEKKFWHENVLKRQEPDFQNIQELSDYTKDKTTIDSVVASEKDYNLVKEYGNLKEKEKILKKEIEDVKFKICSKMMMSECMNDANGQVIVTWKSRETERFDSTRFKKENKELYDKYIKKTSARYFLTKN